MNKTLIPVLALLFSGAAVAGDDFQSLDTDQDGYISTSEASKSDQLSSNWSKADSNVDGKVDKAEFSALEITDDQGESGQPAESMPPMPPMK